MGHANHLPKHALLFTQDGASERANILFDLRKEPDCKSFPEVKSVSVCASRPYLMAAACKDPFVRVWDRYVAHGHRAIA